MKSLNIIIIAAVDLPEGGGETTRLKTLAGAIKSAGHKVQILLENTSGNIDDAMLQPRGSFDGVPFRYILGDVKPLTGLRFFTGKYKAVSNLVSEIKQLHSREKVDVIWINQLAFHTIYPLTQLARKLGIKVIHSYEDERIKGNGLKRKLIYYNQLLADKYMSPKADAIVVISHYLKEKYEKLSDGKVPVHIIPTIVNIKNWQVGAEPDNDIPLLLYYGSFYGFDEIELLMDAVKLLKDNGKNVKIYLVGHNRKNPAYMQSLADRANELGLNENVIFKGFTKHDKLREYIAEANVLIGLRKDDEWSRTGLSTKLSEYLSTGRLVICTAIGDNTKYLEDKKSALLMKPGCSARELAETIQLAVDDDILRKQIGNEGFKVAKENFDAEAVKNKINQLLEKAIRR